LMAIAGGADPRGSSSAPSPADDWTFRPTVVVRRGTAQGSGTIIASLDGETLVLTAAHVVSEKDGAPEVELHRYNLGQERSSRIAGGWPRTLVAEVVAIDRAADLAVLRIGRLRRLPYVARLDTGMADPARGTVVTSIGIDLGEHLSSWMAHVAGVDWFLLDRQTEERPFLITTRPPEHGRSGGGLFLADGHLVGVCIGRTEETKSRRVGIFASSASVRRLLRDHDLEETVALSDALGRQANAARRADPGVSGPASASAAGAPSVVRPLVPTQARPPGRPARERLD
jgi:S1-C subfamily serine protease